jgi:hypothetical protein
MRIRLLPLAVFLVLMAVRPATAEDKKTSQPSKPTVIIRVSSLDDVLADFHYLAALVGETERFEQARKTVISALGEKALDTTRPIGIYGFVLSGGIDSQAVVLLPVADEKAVLDTIKGFGLTPEKQKDGAYKLELPVSPFPVFFTFANKYAYVTVRDEEVLKKDRLLDPATVLAGGGAVSLVVNLDEIPKDIKEIVLSYEGVLQASLKEKEVAGETEAQKAFRQAAVDELFSRFQELIVDGGALSVRLDLDRKTGGLSVVASLAGKPDSKLAKDFAGLGELPSVAAGIIGADSAVNFQLHVGLPANLRRTLAPAIEDALKQLLEKAKQEGKANLVEPLLKAIAPTAKLGEVDAGVSVRGPDAAGLYTIVGAVKLKEGKALEQPLKDLLNDKEIHDKMQATVTIDFDKAGDVNIHKAVPDKVDEKTRKSLGDGTTYFALRDDALVFAAGSGALDAIKTAIAASPASGKLVHLQVAMSRLAPFLAIHNNTSAVKVKKAFTEGDDTIHITLEGGTALKLNVDLKTQLLKSFVAIDKETGKKVPPAKKAPEKE